MSRLITTQSFRRVAPLFFRQQHPRPNPHHPFSFPSILSKLPSLRPFSAPPTKPEKHENIYTIPNVLTFSRLLATPAIAYLILHDKPYLATGLLLYAGLTDLVDGWIARKYNLQSVVGTIIDPMADKFLMISLTGALAYTGAMPGYPVYVTDDSVVGGDYSWQRCRIRDIGVVLSVYFTSAAKDVCKVLGFLVAFCGGSSYYYQQGILIFLC
jgi:phosphatidylglycerophosphate synthase